MLILHWQQPIPISTKTNSPDDLNAIMSNSEKATALYKEFPGQVSDYTYAIARNNTASYLLKYFPKLTDDLRKQIEYNIGEALNASTHTAKPQSIQAGGFGMLANLATRDNDLNKAEQYLLQAETMLLTQSPVYYYIMIQIVNDLAELYEKKGDLTKALEYQKKVTKYSIEQFNEDEAANVKDWKLNISPIKRTGSPVAQNKNFYTLFWDVLV